MLQGELVLNEPLSNYTSWRAGGKADRLYRPKDLPDLLEFIRSLGVNEPVFWLGLGSNVLVRDGGIRGTVICTKGRLNEMRRMDSERIYVEAGVSCAKAAKFCDDLTGIEFLSGIPGTLGGALAMNAGAFGGEVWDWVEAVVTVDSTGSVKRRLRDEFKVGYRSVQGMSEGEHFLAAELRLKLGDRCDEHIKSLLLKRKQTQPLDLPSCGSVFRNPENDHAGRLIEASGLKGFAMGGARVSEKHANFIVNTGGASSSDIEALIFYVRDQVEKKTGIRLVPEVKIVGEAVL